MMRCRSGWWFSPKLDWALIDVGRTSHTNLKYEPKRTIKVWIKWPPENGEYRNLKIDRYSTHYKNNKININIPAKPQQ
jgi:hypothetical protein